MALALSVDKLDSVPEALRALYTEKDGKFRLDVEGIEDTTGLKSALDKERKDRSAFEKQVKAWQGIGKTPDEIAELLREQEERTTHDAEKKGEWDKLRAQMNEKHEAALKAKDADIVKMRATLEKHLVDSQAVTEIAKLKGVPELLLPHVQRQVRVDDEFKVTVVDAKGDPRVNGKGEPLSIADLIAEMRQHEVFGRAFDGSGKSGSGTPPNGRTGGTGNDKKEIKRSDFDALDPLMRHKAMQQGLAVVD
jgi:hypothetical protein